MPRMRSRNLLATVLLAWLAVAGSAYGEQQDEAALRTIVREEIERLFAEGALDQPIRDSIYQIIHNAQDTTLTQTILPVDPSRDHIRGNPNAEITLVEYSDFSCPYCQNFHKKVIQLLENKADTVRWVYRHFPLDIHQPAAQMQAEASECVASMSGNDVFWQFTDNIYQDPNSHNSVKSLRQLAEKVGVAGDAFSSCLESREMRTRVSDDYKNGLEIGVTGTPATFISNRDGTIRTVIGSVSANELEMIVDDLL